MLLEPGHTQDEVEVGDRKLQEIFSQMAVVEVQAERLDQPVGMLHTTVR